MIAVGIMVQWAYLCCIWLSS